MRVFLDHFSAQCLEGYEKEAVRTRRDVCISQCCVNMILLQSELFLSFIQKGSNGLNIIM